MTGGGVAEVVVGSRNRKGDDGMEDGSAGQGDNGVDVEAFAWEKSGRHDDSDLFKAVEYSYRAEWAI